jgi:hypothetical protein
MNGDGNSDRSRLCPDHRRDHVSSGACVACAQTRRIAELEQIVERLVARVEELEQDDETTKTAQETRPNRSEDDAPDRSFRLSMGKPLPQVGPRRVVMASAATGRNVDEIHKLSNRSAHRVHTRPLTQTNHAQR